MADGERAATCPLCGADNRCAVATGAPAASCWCHTATLDPAAVTRAAALDRERCVCTACGQSREDRTIAR